ncbi:MAG: hypothetical protein Ct9H300mP1_23290 [Planctomycetaceae bacterium]|nr:MAG: hypothetical protein Ct9H300mP1_23290 [Planctomycetaceae bacterium]
MPNRLLVQQPDGTVRDQARLAGFDWLDRSRSALLVDFDNDGDQDLACVLNINLVLMENDGRGRFTEREMAFATGDRTRWRQPTLSRRGPGPVCQRLRERLPGPNPFPGGKGCLASRFPLSVSRREQRTPQSAAPQ